MQKSSPAAQSTHNRFRPRGSMMIHWDSHIDQLLLKSFKPTVIPTGTVTKHVQVKHYTYSSKQHHSSILVKFKTNDRVGISKEFFSSYIVKFGLPPFDRLESKKFKQMPIIQEQMPQKSTVPIERQLFRALMQKRMTPLAFIDRYPQYLPQFRSIHQSLQTYWSLTALQPQKEKEKEPQYYEQPESYHSGIDLDSLNYQQQEYQCYPQDDSLFAGIGFGYKDYVEPEKKHVISHSTSQSSL